MSPNACRVGVGSTIAGRLPARLTCSVGVASTNVTRVLFPPVSCNWVTKTTDPAGASAAVMPSSKASASMRLVSGGAMTTTPKSLDKNHWPTGGGDGGGGSASDGIWGGSGDGGSGDGGSGDGGTGGGDAAAVHTASPHTFLSTPRHGSGNCL